MNKKYNHKHRGVLLILFAITALLFAMVVVVATIGYQDFLEVRTLRAAVLTDKSKAGAFLRLKTLAEQTDESAAEIIDFVATKNNLVNIIDLAERGGGWAGAAVTVVSVDETGVLDKKTKKNVLTGWKLDLKLEGDFDDVRRGLAALEALPVAKRVVRIGLHKTPDKWEGGMVLELPTIK